MSQFCVSSGFQGLPGWPCEPVTGPSNTSVATSSSFFVSLTVAMPYSKAQFNSAKQLFFEAAVAGAAGTDAANVDIVSVTETSGLGFARRLLEESARGLYVDVETKVLLWFSLGVSLASMSR